MSVLIVYHFPHLTLWFVEEEHNTLQILNICTKKQKQPRTKSLSICKLWAEKHTSPCFQPFNMLIWKWTFSPPCLLVSPSLPTQELEESYWFLGTAFSGSVPIKLVSHPKRSQLHSKETKKIQLTQVHRKHNKAPCGSCGSLLSLLSGKGKFVCLH